MREFLLRLRVPLLLGVLLLGALGSMLLERTGAGPGAGDRGYGAGFLLEIAAPLQKAVAWPVDAASSAYRHYLDLLGLRAENEALRTQVAELLEENLQFREALVDGGRLANIVAMREDFEVPLLPAQVVGQDVSPWFRSVLVDRGNANQLRAGMPVVTEHGVAGVLRATSPHAARAMLLLDRQSAIDGIVQRSRARGIVRGTGSGDLEFVFVVRGDDVEAGDVVISSGLGGVYPKGLRIGDVVQVSRDEASLLHTARVRPAVDFGSLEQVFVMLWRGPEMALLYGGEGDSRGVPEASTGRKVP